MVEIIHLRYILYLQAQSSLVNKAKQQHPSQFMTKTFLELK